MISNQAPQGRVPAVRLEGGALSRAGGSLWSRLSGMNVSVLREVALLPVLALLIVVGSVVSPAFFTVSNFAGIGEQSSALGVVVVGESLILLIGGMDLSLESTFGLAPMIAAWLIVPVAAYGAGTDLSPYLGILVLLAVGAVVGLVNGLLIVKGRLNGFIVTLGMTIVLAGLQNGVVKAQSLFNLPYAFGYLGSASYGQLPVSLIDVVHADPRTVSRRDCWGRAELYRKRSGNNHCTTGGIGAMWAPTRISFGNSASGNGSVLPDCRRPAILSR